MFLMEDAGKMSVRGATFCGLLGLARQDNRPLKKSSVFLPTFFFHKNPRPPTQIIASPTRLLYSAGDSDACVERTLNPL